MSAETGAWMPIYWGDYFGDTMHLTTEEHGAYLLLIGTYWRRARPLPDDDKWLASVTKMSLKRWKKVRPKISEFFEISDGEWTHKRVIKEALKSSARLQSARAAGRAGGLAKSYLTTTTATKNKRKAPSGPKERAPPTRGTRLPDNWILPDGWLQWAIQRDLDGLLDLVTEGERFRNHWTAKAGKDATKILWERTWQNWVIKAIEMARERKERGHGNGSGKVVLGSPVDDERRRSGLAKAAARRLGAGSPGPGSG